MHRPPPDLKNEYVLQKCAVHVRHSYTVFTRHNWLYNQIYNQLYNRLYRVNVHFTGQTCLIHTTQHPTVHPTAYRVNRLHERVKEDLGVST